MILMVLNIVRIQIYFEIFEDILAISISTVDGPHSKRGNRT